MGENMTDSTFWEKKHDWQHIVETKHDWQNMLVKPWLAAHYGKKYDLQHILAKNMIDSTFWEKNIIGSTFWENHDWQHILKKQND